MLLRTLGLSLAGEAACPERAGGFLTAQVAPRGRVGGSRRALKDADHGGDGLAGQHEPGRGEREAKATSGIEGGEDASLRSEGAIAVPA